MAERNLRFAPTLTRFCYLERGQDEVRVRKYREGSIQWTRELFATAAPRATGGVYVNFMPEDEVERVTVAYGANCSRLAALKAKYDPGNLFRMNQNLRRAA
jgi:hypothetical protein